MERRTNPASHALCTIASRRDRRPTYSISSTLPGRQSFSRRSSSGRTSVALLSTQATAIVRPRSTAKASRLFASPSRVLFKGGSVQAGADEHETRQSVR